MLLPQSSNQLTVNYLVNCPANCPPPFLRFFLNQAYV